MGGLGPLEKLQDSSLPFKLLFSTHSVNIIPKSERTVLEA